MNASKRTISVSTGIHYGSGQIELVESFPSEEAAIRFAMFFQTRTQPTATKATYVIAPLVTPSGGITSWYRLAVPARLLARAEDMRAAWDAGYRVGLDTGR